MMSNMNTWEVLSHVMSLAIAYALALPIGWNREQEERSGGDAYRDAHRLRLKTGLQRYFLRAPSPSPAPVATQVQR